MEPIREINMSKCVAYVVNAQVFRNMFYISFFIPALPWF